jgi:hypothetical protein
MLGKMLPMGNMSLVSQGHYDSGDYNYTGKVFLLALTTRMLKC